MALKTKAKVDHIDINTSWCKGCGICIGMCPTQVLEFDEHLKAMVAHLEKCINCKLCELLCPELAVSVEEAENE